MGKQRGYIVMAEIEEVIISRLKATSAVTSIIGSGSNARIYAVQADPNAVVPFIVYSRQSSQRFLTMGGPIANKWDTFELNCVSRTYAQARELVEAVREALEFYSSSGPPVLNLIEFEGQTDTIIDDEAAEIQLFHCMTQFVVKYEE